MTTGLATGPLVMTACGLATGPLGVTTGLATTVMFGPKYIFHTIFHTIFHIITE
jgi:hypothetical protein